MTRAVVLGGGGPVGIAWESGLVSGLARAGVDLGQADFIMGTSAGSFVGARLALGDPAADLADPILAEAGRAPPPSPTGNPATPPHLTPLMKLMAEMGSGQRSREEVRREIGAFSLAAATPDEATFIKSFGRSFAGLPEDAWPERDFACTAVDTENGAFKLWTRADGVGVVRAVASSCSVPGVYPPITIQGRRWMDGGMRSTVNADLATGHDMVLVIAVRTGGSGPMADRAKAQVDAEVKVLTDAGATVEVLSPDAGSAEAMGINLMDFRKRADAARAGLAQGMAEAERLRGFWS